MTSVILKYPVESSIAMPAAAQILAVQVQDGVPKLWAIVPVGEPLVHRKFVVRGTGTTFEGDEGTYIGTWQAGEFVWHLFEVTT